ncbi:predicted protein [Histoplasma capsulatum G186AR]|uniref:Uncharacterized protein n=1 Tax=Ajellomyces capsulatus (strain G186AR / H82 / ATCC MYA-2454 / RMSCC 2432) TaxID=447093 RepID=C0NX77_AJECG|nr:uncharacterized protein HCBG_08069 [Histoplasma capsulatum G186AR]EEH03943.1 predicted protein [Histoplasma capsulatum G186AR]
MALRAVSLQMDSREVQAGAPLDNAEIEDFTFQTLTLSRKRALITRSTSCLLKKNSRLPNNTDNVGSNLQDRRRPNHYRNQGTGHSYWKILILNACTCSRVESEVLLPKVLQVAFYFSGNGEVDIDKGENRMITQGRIPSKTESRDKGRDHDAQETRSDSALASPVPYLSSQPCLGLLYNYDYLFQVHLNAEPRSLGACGIG